MCEKLSVANDDEENLHSLLESLGLGLLVLQGVEENLTCLLESFNHNQETLKGTVKKCVFN